MFRSSSIVALSYGRYTSTPFSLAFVATSTTSFSDNVGLKFLLLFQGVCILFDVVASIDLFSYCCRLVLLKCLSAEWLLILLEVLFGSGVFNFLKESLSISITVRNIWTASSSIVFSINFRVDFFLLASNLFHRCRLLYIIVAYLLLA